MGRVRVAVLLEESSCGLRGLGSADQEALKTVAAFQHFQLLLGFDSFRHNIEPQAVAETDDGVRHRAVVLVGRDVVYEAAIDLEAVERKRREVGERGILCWFSVKMTARLDVNATPGVRMSPLAPGIVPECSGASRVKRAARAGFAALDSPCALWYSLVVGERERSGAPGIRVFMRAPCYYAAHAAPLVPAPVSGPAPTRSLGPCQP